MMKRLTVTILTLQENDVLSGVVIISCVATDNEAVEKVELWLDGEYSGISDATEPYKLEWNTTEYANRNYVVTVRAYDVNGNKSDSNPINVTLYNNLNEPVAYFIVSPASGTTTTTFTFNASGSSDNEDATSALQVRWDWENDGAYDTNYSTDKTTTHQYNTVGTYIVKLEVKDSDGLTNTTTKTVNINQPDTQITGIAHFLSGISGELNGSVVYVYTSIDNWNNYSSIYSGSVSGMGSSVSFALTGIGINLGNYYLDIWKDNDNDGIRGSPGDYIGWYGTGELGNYVLTEFSISEGQTLNFDITVYIVPEANTVSDIDGNIYNTIQIGNQLWMAENLKVTHYQNGEAIPNVTGDSEWISITSGAYCSYDNNDSNINTYGLLYNWYAVDDPRGLAPVGWRIPSDEEWKQLEIYLGMSQTEADDTGWRGTDEGRKLKETGTTHWSSPNTGATNSSGFTALPGGYRSQWYILRYRSPRFVLVPVREL